MVRSTSTLCPAHSATWVGGTPALSRSEMPPWRRSYARCASGEAACEGSGPPGELAAGTGLPVARGRRTGCSVAATSLRERSRSIPDPMPAVGPSLRPCATGGRSAGRLAGCGTRPRRRASGRPCPAHQHACRPGTPRARQRSRGPTGQLPTGAPPVSLPARCCLRAPQCRAQVRTTRRAIRIRARGTGGSPLKVIGYSASGPGYPGCAGETGWLSASGRAPRLRRHPWGAAC
jgi:hypothetical protein